ncbi:hypothetical protein PIB30_064827 [Stylosanthes scabra]|uniref:Uncharacterized protein n=1 Tax=Stylosanthes scabra TaxID=79078 RepID=A0ABU6YKK8_9FABA|nr:hypothetical protein [Stylosanthes scabra]
MFRGGALLARYLPLSRRSRSAVFRRHTFLTRSRTRPPRDSVTTHRVAIFCCHQRCQARVLMMDGGVHG